MKKIKNEKIFTETYLNVDTHSKHNLLIYEYSINNIKNCNIVIGEVTGNFDNLISYLKRIIYLKVTNSHPLFICSCIKDAKENNAFDNIKFSYDGYNLLFAEKNYGEIYKNLSNNLKSIIVDPTSKRFSSIKYKDVFYPISHFEELENINVKQYQKVINN